MFKRLAVLLAFIVIVAPVLSGCDFGGGGGGGGGTVDEDAVKAAVQDVIDSYFVPSVNDYDVDGMLGCLSGSDFTLRIQEGTAQTDKTYAKLQEELVADEDNQFGWRAAYGYWLSLELGDPTYSNITSTGAMVVQTFEVHEGATGDPGGPVIPDTITDTGTITFEFILTSGEWKIDHMNITFDEFRSLANNDEGFSFGEGYGDLS